MFRRLSRSRPIIKAASSPDLRPVMSSSVTNLRDQKAIKDIQQTLPSLSKTVVTPPPGFSRGTEPVILKEVKNRNFKAKDFQLSTEQKKIVVRDFVKQRGLNTLKEGDEYVLSLSRGREILSAKPKGEYVISLTNNKDIVFSHPYPNTNRLYPALSLDSALNDFSKTIPPSLPQQVALQQQEVL